MRIDEFDRLKSHLELGRTLPQKSFAQAVAEMKAAVKTDRLSDIELMQQLGYLGENPNEEEYNEAKATIVERFNFERIAKLTHGGPEDRGSMAQVVARFVGKPTVAADPRDGESTVVELGGKKYELPPPTPDQVGRDRLVMMPLYDMNRKGIRRDEHGKPPKFAEMLWVKGDGTILYRWYVASGGAGSGPVPGFVEQNNEAEFGEPNIRYQLGYRDIWFRRSQQANGDEVQGYNYSNGAAGFSVGIHPPKSFNGRNARDPISDRALPEFANSYLHSGGPDPATRGCINFVYSKGRINANSDFDAMLFQMLMVGSRDPAYDQTRPKYLEIYLPQRTRAAERGAQVKYETSRYEEDYPDDDDRYTGQGNAPRPRDSEYDFGFEIPRANNAAAIPPHVSAAAQEATTGTRFASSSVSMGATLPVPSVVAPRGENQPGWFAWI